MALIEDLSGGRRATLLRSLTDPALRGLYGSIFLVGAAVAAEAAFLSLYLREAGLDAAAIGALAAVFAVGGVAVAAPLTRVDVEPKRLLVAALSVFGLALASLPFVARSTPLLVAVRLVEGAAMVAIWIGYEAALFSRAPSGERGTVSALYAMVLAFGYVAGPLLAGVSRSTGTAALPFWAAGALTLGNALWVQLGVRGHARRGTEHADAPVNDSASTPARATSFRALAWRAKATGVAMFGTGYLKASLVVLLPLYLVDHRAFAAQETPLVLSTYAAGALSFTLVAGRLGDRHGHLRLMTVLATVGGGAMLAFIVFPARMATLGIALVAGASLATISPLAMALQANVVNERDYGRAMSLSNGLYAAGTLAGPLVTGALYARAPHGAVAQIAAMWLAFAVFGVIFAKDDPARLASR